jgi:Domain of unknown function (DUF4401)
MTRSEFLDAMQREGQLMGLTLADMPETSSSGSWIVRALLGTMGWLGGMLVLVFLGMFLRGLLDSIAGLAILSVSLFVGSFALYRARPHSDFANQFAFSASICAQALAVALLFKVFGSNAERSVAIAVALMQIALVLLMPNYLHRAVSTLFAVLALFFAARNTGLAAVANLAVAGAFAAVSLYESKLVAQGQRAWVAPVWAGLALGVLGAAIAQLRLYGEAPLLAPSIWSGATFGFVLMFWAWGALSDTTQEERGWAGNVMIVLFVIVGVRAPGLAACALVLFAAYRSGRRAFVGLALMAILSYLSGFYYQLEYTLLEKSMMLATLGGALLAGWAAHRRWFWRSET